VSDSQRFEDDAKMRLGRMAFDVHNRNSNPVWYRAISTHSEFDVVMITKKYWDELMDVVDCESETTTISSTTLERLT